MSEFFWNTITENMKFVLNGVSQSEIGDYFYLAGGTALALQLGHRRSVDLDFFSPTEDIPTIRPRLDEALAAFESAENESDPALQEPVSWQTVKEYFVQQAKELGQSWLS